VPELDDRLAFTPATRRPPDRLVQSLARFLLEEAARAQPDRPHPAPAGPPPGWWRHQRMGRRALRRLIHQSLVEALRLEAEGSLAV
jgi:hypothetical protein